MKDYRLPASGASRVALQQIYCYHNRMKKTILQPPVGWGIIGCGDVTEVKSGPGFQKADNSRLVAVMRRTGHLARDYAERHGVPAWYDDADKLIADPAVTSVYIATPPETHLEYALAVAAAGKPAYVEKPMGRNHAECEEMIRAFGDAELPLYVAYYRRALPRFVKVKELLDRKAIGTLTGVTLHFAQPRHNPQEGALPWRLTAESAGGGLVMDMGSHAVDIVDYLLGPMEDVTGNAWNLAHVAEVEDRVVGTFTAGGVPGCASWNFAAAEEEDLLAIDGTEGAIRLSVFGNDPVRAITSAGEQQFDLPNPAHVQQPLIQTVTDDLTGRGTCPSTGESAARTNAVLDRMLSRYYGGRDDAYWSRPESWPGRGE